MKWFSWKVAHIVFHESLKEKEFFIYGIMGSIIITDMKSVKNTYSKRKLFNKKIFFSL